MAQMGCPHHEFSIITYTEHCDKNSYIERENVKSDGELRMYWSKWMIIGYYWL